MPFERVGWPAGTRRIAVASPGFTASPPVVDAPDRIPSGIRATLDSVWTSGPFAPREVEVLRVPHAYLAEEGLVFDDDLNVVAGSITDQPPHHVDQARAELATAIASGSVVERDGPLVLCVKPGRANYGHWLVEMLPKADLAMRVFPGEPLGVLVPDVEGGMRAVVADSLARLGIPSGRVVPGLRTPERVSDLVVVSGLTVHGSYMSPLVFRTLDKLASGIATLPGHERIFVRRRVPAYRRIWNEEAICDVLLARGYAVVSPEEHPLERQIAMFKGARQVIGTASAALTNIAFSRPGTEAAILYPASMSDTFYWFIAQHRRLDYRDIRCEEIGPQRTHLTYDRDLMTEPGMWKPLLASGRARMRPGASTWRAIRRAIGR